MVSQKNKLDILLQNYNSLCSHIDSMIRTSYQIGFGTVTTAVLVSTYAIITKEKDAFLAAVPFIFFIGAVIYGHVAYLLILYSAHRKKIENKVNKLVKSKLLDIENTIGLYGANQSFFTKIIILIIFIVTYGISILFGYLSYGENSSIENMDKSRLSVVYVCITIILVGIAWVIISTYRKQIQKIEEGKK